MVNCSLMALLPLRRWWYAIVADGNINNIGLDDRDHATEWNQNWFDLGSDHTYSIPMFQPRDLMKWYRWVEKLDESKPRFVYNSCDHVINEYKWFVCHWWIDSRWIQSFLFLGIAITWPRSILLIIEIDNINHEHFPQRFSYCFFSLSLSRSLPLSLMFRECSRHRQSGSIIGRAPADVETRSPGRFPQWPTLSSTRSARIDPEEHTPHWWECRARRQRYIPTKKKYRSNKRN